MKIEDLLWGKFEIREPVLCEIIASSFIQRLKGVNQMGAPDKWFGRVGFSRYDHSVGTMLFLRRHGATLEEQIAGLIHDLPHTTFSHLIDWIYGDAKKENFQDENHVKYIKERTNLLEIVAKHDLSEDCVLNPERYALLEQPAPDICADRLDYSLREMRLNYPLEIAEFLTHSLVRVGDRFVFSGGDSAYAFYCGYNALQSDSWASPHTLGVYHLLSTALKTAIDDKILEFDDFYTMDEEVIQKLRTSQNSKIQLILETLNNGFEAEYNDASSLKPHKKFRYVNPPYLDGREIKTVSDMPEVEYEKWLSEEKKKYQNGIGISIKSPIPF
jgi:HD superfamily phosphohydrolase